MKKFEEIATDFEYLGDLAKVREAYLLATQAHKGQQWIGREYIEHPIEVAKIVASMERSEEEICAAFMHDIINSGNVSLEEIERVFGHEISFIVDGVTDVKLNMNERNKTIYNHHKLVLYGVKNIRVMVVKLSKQLHTMRNIGGFTSDIIIDNAYETNRFYAPIAEVLGMREMAAELQDVALKCMCSAEYDECKRLREQIYGYEKRIRNLEEILKKRKIKAEIKVERTSVKDIYNLLYLGLKVKTTVIYVITENPEQLKDIESYNIQVISPEEYKRKRFGLAVKHGIKDITMTERADKILKIDARYSSSLIR